jgi:hypothetical protein
MLPSESFRIDGKRINEFYEELKEKFGKEQAIVNLDSVNFLDKVYEKNVIIYYDYDYSEICLADKNGYHYLIFDLKGKLIRIWNSSVIDSGDNTYIDDREGFSILNKNGRTKEIFKTCGSMDISTDTYYFPPNLSIDVIRDDRDEKQTIEIVEYNKRENIPIWNPKDLNLYIPKRIRFIFLEIYFLLKLICKPVKSRDLIQHVFSFLYVFKHSN